MPFNSLVYHCSCGELACYVSMASTLWMWGIYSYTLIMFQKAQCHISIVFDLFSFLEITDIGCLCYAAYMCKFIV